jgi:hypothetical protein
MNLARLRQVSEVIETRCTLREPFSSADREHRTDAGDRPLSGVVQTRSAHWAARSFPATTFDRRHAP